MKILDIKAGMQQVSADISAGLQASHGLARAASLARIIRSQSISMA